MEKFNKEENEKKYGDANSDIIAQGFKVSKLNGASFCFRSILKYLKRYNSDSEKAKNESDLKKSNDFAKRLFQEEILTSAQMLSIETMIEKKMVRQLYNYILLLESAVTIELENEIFERKFNELLKQNYASIKEHRKLISDKSKKIDFAEKIKEETEEFEYEFLQGNENFISENAKFELADILLTTFNTAVHYGINTLVYLKKKININEKR